MENKKGAFPNHTPNHVPQSNEPLPNESLPKHPHQHNTAPQHLRYLQYGLKIPNNHQHPQQFQQLNSPIHLHPHIHTQQLQYRLQASPQFNNYPNQEYAPHQHQKVNNLQNQPIYQTTQPPPSAGHAHNPMGQNTPQIWVPHQPPPIHYHQQQLQKAEAQKPSNPTPPVQGKSKEVLERKKSTGSVQLRSPSAKRPLEAPVTMQGWLHKQGSEGLMLWKKRWFVLSEYCLFYYKGLEEEKLLGSILLPSYKVSICKPEEKIGKKYAFKCEHANMRTYVLAADSQELMMQWVRVLNMACMLQTNNENEQRLVKAVDNIQQTKPTDTPEQNNSRTQIYNKPSNLKITHSQTHSPNNMLNASPQEQSQYNQPLYANAPPKPRRLNDGYSSPSPDIIDRYNPQYIEPMNISKSPVNIYGNSVGVYGTKDSPREYMFTPTGEIHVHSVERRTPDTYGRSKLTPNRYRQPTDYEDVYAEQSMYKRPLSPVAYTHVMKKTNPPTPLSPAYRAYTPVNMMGPMDMLQYPLVKIRKLPNANIARPHSADFLEYEINHRQSNTAALNRQQPRPKSSLDINRNANDSDNYFYSEELYAEKMRKSAQYLQKMPNRYKTDVNARTNASARYPEHDNTFPLIRSSTQPVNFNKLHIPDTPEPQPMRSRSVLSEGSLSKEVDMDYCSHQESVSPDYARREMFGTNPRSRDCDQFTRSASARLAQNTPQMDRPAVDKRSMIREGERKREESMRRLLEWKQRMLQSPLNRKLQGNKGYPGNHMNQENDYKFHMHPKHGEHYLDERHCRRNLPQYNSYSSDDEENEERRKEIVQSQAGRTLDNYPELPTPAQTTSTTVLSTFAEPEKPFTHSNLLHDAPYTNVYVDKHSEEETSKDKNDNSFAKPQFSKESSDIAQVSHLQSEYSEKFESTPPITEMKSNGALVMSILADFEKKSNVNKESESDMITITIEENYMPMSPKRSVLSPRSSTNSIEETLFNESETDENHYVEMTQNAGASILSPTSESNQIEQQPYELVCFNGGKLEPVYMELKNPEGKSNNGQELPDILMASKRNTSANKSDSSDADDEASKDLDSLDTPSHPRFSLSDSFRPASYYLGAAQTAPEFHDSSDSELVSPPPIPSSPPPLDDLDNIEEYNFLKGQNKKDETYRFNLLTRSAQHRNSDQFFNSNNKYAKKSAHVSCRREKGSSLSLDINKPSVSLSDKYFDENKLRVSVLSTNSDSDIELRQKTANYETMLKRRPVSEDVCTELESLDGTLMSECIQNVELERYFDDMQIRNLSIASNDDSRSNSAAHQVCFPEYENLLITATSVHNTSTELNYTQRDESTRRSVHSGGRPESSTSTLAEISSILQNSNRSTPIIDVSTSNTICQISAPYYYSDLSINMLNNECSSSMLTLNNQRETINGSKRDITHIINPIKSETQDSNQRRSDIEQNTFKLAAEARSVSVDFLNLTDKSGNIDQKNIYESDTLKRHKVSDLLDPKARNYYPVQKTDKFTLSDVLISSETRVRRSHSLEGLIENVFHDSIEPSQVPEDVTEENQTDILASEGSYLWEEDSIWRERLRTASQRHTKSMEDLDSIGDTKKKQKSPRGITRGVTYVNDNFIKLDKHQKDLENQKTVKSSENEIRKEGSFIIDREKLRQWDLLSSAPSDDQLSALTATQVEGSNIVVEIGEGNCDSTDINDTQETASGSISINTRDMSQLNSRDTFPRAISAKKIWTPSTHMESRSVTNLCRNPEKEQYGLSNPQVHYTNKNSSHGDPNPDSRKDNWPTNDKMSVSAGELLGRTHEELVLLLIQLRRQSSQTLQAIENCYNEIDSIQAQLNMMMDQARRMENLQKLDQIKQHLLDLEKQYEKGKPLVNLVDNMVKLGSLYRVPNDRANPSPGIRDRLEFNQQIQERRMLAEEKRDWNRLKPNHFHLQEKVQQLYQLDRLIHEESGTLQNLQQDKEDIERALGGLRHRLSKGFKSPAEVEHARKQQIMLENELSRVHIMLAQNSKKLEETVAGNARLEQELLVLKQKLQGSRQQRSSQQYSNAGDSLTCTMGNSAMLESDLQRVQKKIGDLQKQRQELSIQVRQLTDRSSNVPQHKSPPSSTIQNSQCNKKKIPSLWRETDLDTMSIIDHGETWESSVAVNSSTSPLYINTEMKLGDSDFYNRSVRSTDSTSDNTSVSSNIPQEKQEIKTVRIVKRESERRQRDREKMTPGKWDALQEEDDSSQSSSVLFRPTPVQKVQSATSLVSPTFEEEQNILAANPHAVSSPNLPQFVEREGASSTDVSTDKSPELSPVFKSEAARQIITEMSIHDTPKQNNRRAVPKEKRRHYTAPHNHMIMKSLHHLPTDNDAFNKMVLNTRRARDDMDMERALRQRIDAPDVVRSTLSNKELKYNENTIDSLLGTPNKINIPERYIPEQLPQLSAEEQEYRLRKVESIKKMLSDSAILGTSSTNLNGDDKETEKSPSSITNKATSKMIEEKRQREHLLQLNQILAKQVMEMSKIVAGINNSDEKT
ncbi:unnamed protein product [Phaedon cochleariae]|uniref:PH domain-containing protein n=1 Tax=Phaedon cochleariae TaxID=80249 RepID=A0A9N9WZ39_PHACE|nr:unnamed protein product [Phaedon cochleariae]